MLLGPAILTCTLLGKVDEVLHGVVVGRRCHLRLFLAHRQGELVCVLHESSAHGGARLLLLPLEEVERR